MNLFKRELEKEKINLGFKSLRKPVTKSDRQTGRSNLKRDKVRKAMPSGKRRSRTGNFYYEYRKNRTDKIGERV